MHYSYLTLLVSSLNAIHGAINSNLNENVLSGPVTSTNSQDTGNPMLRALMNYFKDKIQDDAKDKTSTENKENVLKHVTNNLHIGRDLPSSLTATTVSNDKNIGRHYFHMDPVFDSLVNRRLWQKKKVDSSSSSSSELEMLVGNEDLEEKRLLLKFQAYNSTEPWGDVVNMKAARPWGYKCGDPNQHDLLWGTCMLREECDAEFRIYRGDSFCGRTEFACCALERTSYDMYQGLDLSFEREDSLSTDTEEDSRLERDKDRRKRRNEKRRNKRTRAQLKKKIRNSITNIITEITRLLQRAYRNGTAHRAKKTKELISFIKQMKEQYRKDRKTLVDAHEFNMANYQIKFEDSLSKVRGFNEEFMSNATFRDLVVNGTINTENLKRLQRTHPVLSLFFKNRRMGGGDFDPERAEMESEAEGEVPKLEKEKPKVLEYDLEYGVLYH